MKYKLLIIMFLLVGCSNKQVLTYNDFLNHYNEIIIKAKQKNDYKFFTYQEENYDNEKNKVSELCYKYKVESYYLNASIKVIDLNKDTTTFINHITLVKDNKIYYYSTVQINKRIVDKSRFIVEKSYIDEDSQLNLYEEYIKEYERILDQNVLFNRLDYLKINFENNKPIFDLQKSISPYIEDNIMTIEFDYFDHSDDEYNDPIDSNIVFNDNSIISINKYYEDESYLLKEYDDQTEVVIEEINHDEYEDIDLTILKTYSFNYL